MAKKFKTTLKGPEKDKQLSDGIVASQYWTLENEKDNITFFYCTQSLKLILGFSLPHVTNRV